MLLVLALLAMLYTHATLLRFTKKQVKSSFQRFLTIQFYQTNGFLSDFVLVDCIDDFFCTLLSTDKALDALCDASEAVLEAADDDDYEINLDSGVLSLSLGARGSYVLNKQVPNRQIWWSSPLSGPMRYHWRGEREQWVNVRDESMDDLTTQYAKEFQQLTSLRIEHKLNE